MADRQRTLDFLIRQNYRPIRKKSRPGLLFSLLFVNDYRILTLGAVSSRRDENEAEPARIVTTMG